MEITPEELQKLIDEAYQRGKAEGAVHYIPMPTTIPPVIYPYYPPIYPTVTWTTSTEKVTT